MNERYYFAFSLMMALFQRTEPTSIVAYERQTVAFSSSGKQPWPQFASIHTVSIIPQVDRVRTLEQLHAINTAHRPD